MMTASILAKKTDVPIYTVRHYTRIGLLKPTRNPGNGYKEYNFSDATRLRFIMAAKDLGFTLSEISHIWMKPNTGIRPVRWSERSSNSGSRKIKRRYARCKDCRRKWKNRWIIGQKWKTQCQTANRFVI